jgi:hypothetical protein
MEMFIANDCAEVAVGSIMLLMDDSEISYIQVDTFQRKIEPLKLFKPKPLKKLKVIPKLQATPEPEPP